MKLRVIALYLTAINLATECIGQQKSSCFYLVNLLLILFYILIIFSTITKAMNAGLKPLMEYFYTEVLQLPPLLKTKLTHIE